MSPALRAKRLPGREGLVLVSFIRCSSWLVRPRPPRPFHGTHPKAGPGAAGHAKDGGIRLGNRLGSLTRRPPALRCRREKDAVGAATAEDALRTTPTSHRMPVATFRLVVRQGVRRQSRLGCGGTEPWFLDRGRRRVFPVKTWPPPVTRQGRDGHGSKARNPGPEPTSARRGGLEGGTGSAPRRHARRGCLDGKPDPSFTVKGAGQDRSKPVSSPPSLWCFHGENTPCCRYRRTA